MPLESDQSTFGRHPGISGCGLVPQVFAAAVSLSLSLVRAGWEKRSEMARAEWRRYAAGSQQTRLWMAHQPRIRMMHLITKSKCSWDFLYPELWGGIVNRFPALCHNTKEWVLCAMEKLADAKRKKWQKTAIRFAWIISSDQNWGKSDRREEVKHERAIRYQKEDYFYC